MTAQPAQVENLSSLTSHERLQAYQTIVDGCHHAWSKNKPVMTRIQDILNVLVPLTESDPYFLAHLTSYVMTKSQSKDMKLFLAYASALSTADGSPFSPGSKYKKPNLRYIGAAAAQMLEPKIADRLLTLASTKFSVDNHLNLSRHFPTALRTALKKYLQYRESNPEMLRGIKKAGLGKVIQNMYRGLHMNPTDTSASILRWEQKDREITMENSAFADFKNLTDLQIAEKVRSEKLPVLGVLGALPRAVSPVIAVALLEQATGNQAVILRKTFEDAGVLTDPEVMKLFTEKVGTAKTALDRVNTLTKDASEAVKQVLKEARSESRKEETKGLGKIYLHLDVSGSMNQVLKYAMERGAIFAECVNDPTNNFGWGLFDQRGEVLPLPQEFVQDAFAAVLFQHRGGWGGGTDAFSLYPTARVFGADVDVFVSDQEHNASSLEVMIRRCHEQNPQYVKPKACVIVDFSSPNYPCSIIKDAYEANGIPVAIIKPNTLTGSALVSEAVKAAMMGPLAQVDEIMETPLLKLPEYYYALEK